MSIVASFQNAPKAELEEAVKEWARTQKYNASGACFVKGRNNNPILHINPAGDWQQGGFDADAGLTGRKLAVDNYGPRIPVGGGPSGNTCPRCESQRAQRTSVRRMPWLSSSRVPTFSATAGSVKEGQPLPESNLASDVKSTTPQARQR